MRKLCIIIFLLPVISFPYLSALDMPEMVVQMGHSDEMNTVNFSHDGRFVVSASKDGTVKLWHVATGKLIRTFSVDYTCNVYCAVFSPDDRFIVSGGKKSSKCEMWDVKTGENLKTFITEMPGITSLAFSRNGKYIAAGSSADGAFRAISVWDIARGTRISSFEDQAFFIKSLIFIENDTRLLVSGEYFDTKNIMFTVKKWDWRKGKEIKLIGEEKDILTITNDGKSFFKLDKDGNLSMQDINKSKDVRHMKLPQLDEPFLTFSPDYSYCATFYGSLIVWDVKTGKVLYRLGNGKFKYNSVTFSNNSTLLISANNNNQKITLWDMENGKKIRDFSGSIDPISCLGIMPEHNYILFGDSSDKSLKMWNINELKLSTISNLQGALTIAISPDEQHCIVAGDEMKLINMEKKEEIWSKKLTVSDIKFSPDGKHYIACKPKGIGSLRLFDILSNDSRWKYADDLHFRHLDFLQNGKYIAAVSTVCDQIEMDKACYSTLTLIDSKTGKKIWACQSCSGYTIDHMTASPSGNYIALMIKKLENWNMDDGSFSFYLTRSWIEVWDVTQGKMTVLPSFSEPSLTYITAISFTPDGEYLITGDTRGIISFWKWKNTDDNKLIKMKEFNHHISHITSLAVSKDSKFLYSGSKDGALRIWNMETGAYVTFLSNSDTGEWLIFTHDGYWDSSRNGGEMVVMVNGTDVWNIDQFAVRNNRPDIILKRLGSVNTKLINHYYHQYMKRLNKLGLNDKKIKEDYHVPVARYYNITQNDKIIKLQVALSDSEYYLKSYNIYINDVPLFGAYGKPLQHKRKQITEEVELSCGNNKIEVSCMNVNGAESFRAVTLANYDKPIKRDLYFLGFGVSFYKDKNINTLRYADKDVEDLSGMLQNMKGYYENVYIEKYVNEEVTSSTIKKAKEFLLNAKPDDTFVLMISGHGLHGTDKNATYYFLTYNTSLARLSRTAADFELIENLLHSIPPRNKLFLMDTCGSGEIDDEIIESIGTQAGQKGIASRSPYEFDKGVTFRKRPGSSRVYLNERDRYIYNDLVRRSGAVVFSSCKGGEVSYENARYENGIFTEWLLRTFTTLEADKDKNKKVSLEELKKYVITSVVEETGSRENFYPTVQHPTVDRDNIYQEFEFPVNAR